MDSIREFINLSRRLEAIVDSRELDWSYKFDLVFTSLAPQIGATGITVEWCDPDMDYDDDVYAYANAVYEKAKQLEPLALELEKLGDVNAWNNGNQNWLGILETIDQFAAFDEDTSPEDLRGNLETIRRITKQYLGGSR